MRKERGQNHEMRCEYNPVIHLVQRGTTPTDAASYQEREDPVRGSR
jgi:hypothetical protein